jgi:DNA modification methylase
MKVANELGRNCCGYEIDTELKPVILRKIGYRQPTSERTEAVQVVERSDAGRFRSFLQKKVSSKKSVTKERLRYHQQWRKAGQSN